MPSRIESDDNGLEKTRRPQMPHELRPPGDASVSPSKSTMPAQHIRKANKGGLSQDTT